MNVWANVGRDGVRISCIAISLLVLLAVATGHGAEGRAVGKEVGEAASAIEQYGIEQKDAAVARAKLMKDDLEGDIDSWQTDMEENWDLLKESSREHYQELKEEFREQREELAVWYDRLQESSAEAWDETKYGFARAYETLRNAWHESRQETLTK